MASKKKKTKKSRTQGTRLTKDKAKAFARACASKASVTEIAKRFGVSTQAVYYHRSKMAKKKAPAKRKAVKKVKAKAKTVVRKSPPKAKKASPKPPQKAKKAPPKALPAPEVVKAPAPAIAPQEAPQAVPA